MCSDEDLDGAVEKTIRVEKLAIVLRREVWNPIEMLGVAYWDRPPPSPVAGCVEATGHGGGFAWESAVEPVESTGAGLVKNLSISSIV